MKGFAKKAAFLLLAAVFLLGAASAPALASTPTPVEPSDTLEVYIRVNGSDTLLHTYGLSEMRSMSVSDVYYSGLDSMPWTVQTVATGVYLEDLLDDVQQYTDYQVINFSKLRFYSTDGAISVKSYKDLFSSRYYFPALHEADGGMNKDGEIACDYGKGIKVKAMLAISSVQDRLPSPSGGDTRHYNPERYTLLYGTTEAELDDLKSIVSDYKRGVCKMVIDMGTVIPDVPVTAIRLDKAAAAISVKEGLQLNVIFEPADATDQKVNWTSSDNTVAKVNSSGVVTGVAEGSAVITATSNGDSSLSASCRITVSGGAVAVEEIQLSEDELTLAPGSTKSLSASVMPADATDYSIEWSSSDTSVVKVSAAGKLTAVAEGKAKVTASAGSISAICWVTVSNDLAIVPVSGVSLDRSSISLVKGGSIQLNAIISPAEATNKELYWSSSAPGVASVDTAGRVSAKNPGSAVITVMTDDGNYTARCTVTVSEQAGAFNDISNSWAKDYIRKMAGMGFINGYTDGSFRPDASISRAEFVSILIRVLQDAKGISLQSGHVFSDTASSWAKEQISTAVAYNIVTGYANGSFGVNDLVTREQIAVMLARSVNFSSSAVSTGFRDNAAIDTWAVPAVAYSAEQGWITGYADGSFGPHKSATRAEVCAMLLRFYQQLK